MIFTNTSLHKSRQIDKLRSARTASAFLSLQHSTTPVPILELQGPSVTLADGNSWPSIAFSLYNSVAFAMNCITKELHWCNYRFLTCSVSLRAAESQSPTLTDPRTELRTPQSSCSTKGTKTPQQPVPPQLLCHKTRNLNLQEREHTYLSAVSPLSNQTPFLSPKTSNLLLEEIAVLFLKPPVKREPFATAFVFLSASYSQTVLPFQNILLQCP